MGEGLRPALSVIVPLVDPRGLALDCIAAWTRQRDARIASSWWWWASRPWTSLPPSADCCAPPTGSSRRRPQRGRAYNAGVAAAGADLLVLTESHCLPEPDTAAELLRSFAATDFDAACLGTLHLSPNRLARQEERLHEQRLGGRDRAMHWGDVSLRGLAVRRSLLAELGGLDERCERFAETTLAIELWRRGIQVVNADRARVRHGNCRSFAELGPAVRALARGQCAWRARVGPELAEPWLGVAASGFADWPERARLSPRHARRALAVALRSLVLDRGREGHAARARALRGEIGVFSRGLCGALAEPGSVPPCARGWRWRLSTSRPARASGCRAAIARSGRAWCGGARSSTCSPTRCRRSRPAATRRRYAWATCPTGACSASTAARPEAAPPGAGRGRLRCCRSPYLRGAIASGSRAGSRSSPHVA